LLPAVTAALDEAGLQRGYLLALWRPADPATADPAEGFASDRGVVSYLCEFADAEAAAAATDHLATAWVDDGAEREPPTVELGEGTVAVSAPYEDPATGEVSHLIDLMIVSDNLVAGVMVERSGSTPEGPEAELLGERMLGRIKAVRDAGGPGLSTRVPHLAGRSVLAEQGEDGYLILDGAPIARFAETEADLAARQERIGEREVVDSYRVIQAVTGGNADTSIVYTAFAQRFHDDEAAADVWDDLRVGANFGEGVSDFEVEAVDGLGDATVLATYTEERAARTYQVRRISIRVGTVIGAVDLADPQEVPDREAVLELAEAQAYCLTTPTGCPDALGLPDALGD
jgi:hypothetical protein